jgi:hypothetical protein
MGNNKSFITADRLDQELSLLFAEGFNFCGTNVINFSLNIIYIISFG